MHQKLGTGVHRVEIDPRLLPDHIAVRYFRPLAAEVQGRPLIGDLSRPLELVEAGLNELADKLHVVPVVPVGSVPLQHREFLKVRRIYTFIPKIFADLVNPIDSTDDQPFEVSLW